MPHQEQNWHHRQYHSFPIWLSESTIACLQYILKNKFPCPCTKKGFSLYSYLAFRKKNHSFHNRTVKPSCPNHSMQVFGSNDWKLWTIFIKAWKIRYQNSSHSHHRIVQRWKQCEFNIYRVSVRTHSRTIKFNWAYWNFTLRGESELKYRKRYFREFSLILYVPSVIIQWPLAGEIPSFPFEVTFNQRSSMK